ncbi:MAG: PEGA domain-containing protein, partial [Myxococcus sp.]|nr:PEGA domain-containing protein [Myxococcus sp.]
MTSLLLLFLSAAPCAPEKCEAECVAGAAKSCVAAAAALQASNPIKAAAFLQRACSAEDGPACAELAALFRGGRGVPADATQARQFEGRACALKVGTSCLELGRAEEKEAALARTAEDTRGGMARSAAYLSAGCDAKVPAACGELARLHAWGCGVKADVTAAARLAKQACDAGDKPACRYLAFFLEEGLGGRRDARRAAELLKANADAKPLAPPPACDDSPGLISFESGARGVEVQVDGLALGAAPVVARLSAGAHVVVARAPAREPVRLELTVTAGQRGRQVLEWPASLRVETTPPGALVTLDGKEAGLTPVTAPLPTGRHEVTVALAGFAREARTVSLAAGEERVERLELRSLPGLAQVSSEPPGAQLEVDGKPVGTTPWSGVLPPGPHRARATLERFLPLDQPFTVSRGEPVTVALAFKADPRFQPALLHVETTPPGASISVDGSIVGVTPWEGEVPRGEHDVELTLAGHVTEQRRVNALGREPYQLKVKLKPVPVVKEQPVVLSVTSQPAGAALQLDGKGVGKTPWSSKVMPGSHEVKLTLAGYELYTDLVAAPGVVQASLTPLPSGVRVSLPSTPGDLQVLIDGQPVAAEGGVYASPPGRHLVELRASGFLPAKTTSAVGPGQVTVVSMKLVPAPVAAKQGLRVTSEPSGAQVSLNDAKVGVTPWEDTALTPGPYRVTVSRPGFEPASVSLEVKKKQVTEHAVALTPSPVPVAIESTPAGARVFVDGDDKGLTPLMVRLPPGKHRAYLVLEGHQTVDELKDVEVAATPRWAWALVS